MLGLILGAAGILIGCSWYLFIRDPLKTRAFKQADWFRDRVRDFRNHTLTLERHSNEYCAVFTDNEWTKLNETLTRLEQVDDDVRHYLKRHEYDAALRILERVNGSVHCNAPIEQVDIEIRHIEGLIDWQRSVHSMLRHVVQNLEVAADSTNRLSHHTPTSSPRPTLVTLADLKKELLEDEELRRLSLQ